MVRNVRRWRKDIVENVVLVLGSLLGRGVRTLGGVVVKVRRDRRHSKSNAFWFSKQGKQDDSRENRALGGDRDDQRAAANAAFTRALLFAAFDKAALQGTKIILRMGLGFDRHHTPPQKSSASKNRDFCDAGFLWVAQLPQETGAALAGM